MIIAKQLEENIRKVENIFQLAKSTNVKVKVLQQGSLLLRLKRKPEVDFPYVEGFDRNNGVPGTIEAKGAVQVGDLLVLINAKSTENMTLKQVKQLLSDAQDYKELVFSKDADQTVEKINLIDTLQTYYDV